MAAAGTAGNKSIVGSFVDFRQARQALANGQPIFSTTSRFTVSSGQAGTQVLSAADVAAAGGTLPVWVATTRSSRDGAVHSDALVGTNPFTNPSSTTIPARVIPVAFRLHAVVTAIDPNTLNLTTAPGNVTINPDSHDHVCIGGQNSVPTRLLMQSPIFQPANFTFGATSVGTTQYIDAFQRANFYNASGGVASSFHILFAPQVSEEPLVIDVPDYAGVAIDAAAFFGACGTLGFVDIAWFDTLLNASILPHLESEGRVDPGTLPVFFVYNTFMGYPAFGLGSCCIGGYHSTGGIPLPIQTYAVSDFDSTHTLGVFAEDVSAMSHELGEWANDPYTFNIVPPWGGVGQSAGGCGSALEVGDPLTGTNFQVTMPNGYTYNLQELAFYSWFLGAPSVAANGWFSNQNTFTTDAGVPCLIY